MSHNAVFLWGEFTEENLRLWLRKRTVTSSWPELNPMEVVA